MSDDEYPDVSDADLAEWLAIPADQRADIMARVRAVDAELYAEYADLPAQMAAWDRLNAQQAGERLAELENPSDPAR